MRVATVLMSVSALAGSGLADIISIRKAMFDVMEKVKAMDKAIVAWPGDLVSGGDMVCKTIELRKSLKACSRAFETSKPLRNRDLRHKQALPFVRLADAVFNLKDHAIAARPKFDGVGATPTIFEVLKAQKDPASELSKSMTTIFKKLPPSFRDTVIPLPGSQTKIIDFARTFLDKELDDLLKQFQPRPDQVSPLTPFVLIAVKFSESIDAGPFCQALPQLMNLLAGQGSLSLGELTDKILKILESSGVHDQIPLDIIRKNAEVFGISPAVITQVLKRFRIRGQSVPLRTFTRLAPKILGKLNLQELVVDPSKIIQFINVFAQTTLGSQAPPPLQTLGEPLSKDRRRRNHAAQIAR
ncbi:hydrophobic surface binding protein A domain-containing protein [Hirsutella rhossiliensis]|uniref:Hydrophobic surface binding protein A domain-containing protein n=1 Tax=Hirsutella rhossiliensis TaxID=111463 RepID=A0A9P8SLP8_9HYPO|nr:hydrophobic surface binding protein A domain-containing protein [Hirsutella rhossiliensis]KAH0967728.1 hydrophobic surface binding protein A domain-containing protein [Hirsutella rhossiliensis]